MPTRPVPRRRCRPVLADRWLSDGGVPPGEGVRGTPSRRLRMFPRVVPVRRASFLVPQTPNGRRSTARSSVCSTSPAIHPSTLPQLGERWRIRTVPFPRSALHRRRGCLASGRLAPAGERARRHGDVHPGLRDGDGSYAARVAGMNANGPRHRTRGERRVDKCETRRGWACHSRLGGGNAIGSTSTSDPSRSKRTSRRNTAAASAVAPR